MTVMVIGCAETESVRIQMLVLLQVIVLKVRHVRMVSVQATLMTQIKTEFLTTQTIVLMILILDSLIQIMMVLGMRVTKIIMARSVITSFPQMTNQVPYMQNLLILT